LSALAFENPSKINVVGGTAGYPRSQAEFVSGLWVMCGWVMEAKANTGILPHSTTLRVRMTAFGVVGFTRLG